MQKKKKGFTLVELLVVIAILAILAAVSVVGYLSFTEKAKESNDSVLVTQLNTVLQADEASDGKPNTMSEALDVLKENGFLVENLTPTSAKNEFLYNLKSNRFEIKSKEEVENSTIANPDLWVIVSDEARLEKLAKNYSVLLDSKYVDTDNIINVNNGFDSNNKTENFNVTYNNTSTKKSVVFNTSNQSLTINGLTGENGDTINHFGNSNKININSVGSNSYHEFGKVSSLHIKDGRIVVESKATVSEIFIQKDANVNSIKVEINSTNVDRLIDDSNKLSDSSIIGNKIEKINPVHVKNIIELDHSLYNKKDKYIIFDNDINTNAMNFDGNLITADSVIIDGNGFRLFGHRTYDPSTENQHKNRYDYKATLRLTMADGIDVSNGLNVELKNLTLENDVNDTTSTTLAVNSFITNLSLINVNIVNNAKNGKGIYFVNNLSFNEKRINVKIDNSTISMNNTGYAIYNDRSAVINVENNSQFTGYSAIYMKEHSKNSAYNFNSSTLSCTNQHDGSYSNFGTFACATGYTTINLHNCKIRNMMEGTSRQALLSLGLAYIEESDAKKIELNITGSETMIIGDILYDSWGIKPLPYKISITGGLFSDSTVSSYIDNLHEVINENTFYRVIKK